MREIVMFNWVSADGYFAAADGNLDWVVADPQQVKAAVEAIPRFDTILFGRKTFDIFQAFWKDAVDHTLTAPDPHQPGHRTREHGAIGMWLNDATKLVFSRTAKNVAWRNTRVLRQLDSREIETIKEQPGRDLMVFGSGSIVSQLTELGLIDEYQLLVCPVFLGRGRLLFDGVSTRVTLRLLQAEPFYSGDVMLRYVRPNSNDTMPGA